MLNMAGYREHEEKSYDESRVNLQGKTVTLVFIITFISSQDFSACTLFYISLLGVAV